MRRTIFIIVALLFILGSFVSTKVFAQTLFIDENGQLFFLVPTGQVLGEEDKKEEKKEEKKEDKREEKKFEQTIEERIGAFRRKIEIRNGQYQEEVRDAAGKRKIKIEDGKLKIRIKPVNEIDKDGDEEDKNEEDEASGSAIVDRVKVRHADDIELRAASGSGVEIRKGRVKARANFPLAVGAGNELIVTTPSGSKMVTVLPDEAVANLLGRGIVSSAVEARQDVELTEEEGKLEYRVKGVKDVKFLGFIPVQAPIQANVSAETGAVTGVTQPFFLSFFGFLFR